MARVEHAAITVVILVAFVADLRVVAPMLVGVFIVWAVRHERDRVAASAGAAILSMSTIAFETDNEVVAWALALGVAVLAGVSAVGPTAKGRRAVGRRGEGSSNRAR